MNQGSTAESSWISSVEKPVRIASPMYQTLSQFGTERRARIVSRPAHAPTSGPRRDSRPLLPISREARAFWKASGNVRPIAIVSPTDFICVVSVASHWGNFSKLNRGTLTTT